MEERDVKVKKKRNNEIIRNEVKSDDLKRMNE